MRHRKAKFQLNRFTSWRKATNVSMARNLLIYQSIKTTKTKAQAARPLIEKLITLAKANTLAAKRQAYKILSDHKLVSLLFGEIAGRFSKRASGYTRILNLGTRRGDNAEVVILEFTEIKKKEQKRPKKEKEAKTETGEGTDIAKELPGEGEEKHKTEVVVKEKPPVTKKPSKKFLGGIRSIFKKERDSL